MEKITASEAESVTMMARVALPGRNSPFRACRRTRFCRAERAQEPEDALGSSKGDRDERRHAEHEVEPRPHLLQPPEHHERKEDGNGACKQPRVAASAFLFGLAEDGPRLHFLEPEQGEDGKEDHDHTPENNALRQLPPPRRSARCWQEAARETGRAEAARAESSRRARSPCRSNRGRRPGQNSS